MPPNQKKQDENFDKHAKDLTPLEEGDTVRMKPFTKGERKWSKATVTRRLGDRSYEVEANGTTSRRNRVPLKKTSEHTPPAPLGTPAPAPVVKKPHPDPLSQATAEVKSCPPVNACLPATQTSSPQKLHTHGTPQALAMSSPMKNPSTAISSQSKIPIATRLGREVKNTRVHDFVYHTK